MPESFYNIFLGNITLGEATALKKDSSGRNILFEGETEAIQGIESLVSMHDLRSCIGSICSIRRYLGHISPKVRDCAANNIIRVLKKAIYFLGYEKDPVKIKEYCEFLSDVCEKLMQLNQQGDISLDASMKFSLNNVKDFLDETMKQIKKIDGICPAESDGLNEHASAVKTLFNFLNHENSCVRNYAAVLLVGLIKKSVDYLDNESDPWKVQEYSLLLLAAVNGILRLDQSGAISVGLEGRISLGKSESVLDALMNRHSTETYCSFLSDKSVSILKQARQSMLGENYSDEFIQADLTQIRDMSIFGSMNRQFQTSQNPDGSFSRFIFA